MVRSKRNEYHQLSDIDRLELIFFLFYVRTATEFWCLLEEFLFFCILSFFLFSIIFKRL